MTNIDKAVSMLLGENIKPKWGGIYEKKDPKAKVRNRGDVVFPAESNKVTDDKDHFPINSKAQARNALARAAQYDSSPKWYKGTKEQLVKAVQRAVRKKYSSIDVGGNDE